MPETDTPLRNSILNMLSPDRPTSERAIEREQIVGCLRRFDMDDVKRTIGELHMENKIRWIAFDGWCRGGRPS